MTHNFPGVAFPENAHSEFTKVHCENRADTANYYVLLRLIVQLPSTQLSYEFNCTRKTPVKNDNKGKKITWGGKGRQMKSASSDLCWCCQKIMLVILKGWSMPPGLYIKIPQTTILCISIAHIKYTLGASIMQSTIAASEEPPSKVPKILSDLN